MRRVLGVLAAASLAAITIVRPAAGQDPEQVRVGIQYQPDYLPALVIPRVKAGPGLERVAAEVDSILRTDLDYADRFEILAVPDSLRLGGSVNYGLWNQLGAVWLVTADVSGSASAPILRVGLHDVVYGRLENIQAFSLPALRSDGFRLAVHRASDAVVRWATGEPGIAATRVAFARRLGDGSTGIYVVDSDGYGLRRVASESSTATSPAFSPDGRRLVYYAQDGDGQNRVVEVELATGRKRTVASSEGVITPTFGPDGALALARWMGSGYGGSYEIFRVGGGQLTRTPGGDALNPSFSPDGSRLAYEATPLGQQQVYVKPVTGGQPALVSRYVRGERGSAAAPDWSPRGDRIAYMGWVGGSWQIFAVNPDGGERRTLTSRGENEDPSWAPDGRHLIFASTQRGGRGLLILDTVSGRTRFLVTGNVDRTPDWSPSLTSDR